MVGGVDIEIWTLPPINTNAYLVYDRDLKEAVLVDAPMEAFNKLKPFLEEPGIRVTALLLTHGHWDHMLDAARIGAAGVAIYGHAEDAPMLSDVEMQKDFMFPGLDAEGCKIDHFVTHGQTLELLGQRVEVLHTPGHSPGSCDLSLPG